MTRFMARTYSARHMRRIHRRRLARAYVPWLVLIIALVWAPLVLKLAAVAAFLFCL